MKKSFSERYFKAIKDFEKRHIQDRDDLFEEDAWDDFYSTEGYFLENEEFITEDNEQTLCDFFIECLKNDDFINK